LLKLLTSIAAAPFRFQGPRFQWFRLDFESALRIAKTLPNEMLNLQLIARFLRHDAAGIASKKT